LPVRPPILCPGCSHRGIFYTLKKLGIHVAGDIGCYALGSAPPFGCLDTTICMGASVTAAFGMELARGEEFAKKCVAVIGDSTFFHSGITGLIDLVYNKGRATILILDNSITAMTGHQDNPGTGKDIRGMEAPQISIEKVVESIGVKRIQIIDPFDLKHSEAVIKEELAADEISVIIVRRPCALYNKLKEPALVVDQDACIGCKICLRLGCPAISVQDGKSSIDPLVCVGCGLCPQVCPKKAIQKAGEKHE
jgi:indolepyruvate ferredoxin oxidoreductase alpha subunit